jgi:TatD DNase family protein
MIDLHCHLDLYPEPSKVIDECTKKEMYVLSVTTTPSAWLGTSALGASSRKMRTALGFHPQLAHQRKHELELFDKYLPETRYVGEIGLDGSLEFKPIWESQTTVLRHILRKCEEEGGRILSVHSRRASGPVLDYLSEHPNAGTPILHWYSGNIRDLNRAIELGCWFSIGPAMVGTDKGRSLVARMPPERVLTESDGPFVKIGNNIAMPWDVTRTYESLSGIWGISEEKIEIKLLKNLQLLLSQHQANFPAHPSQ